MGFVLPFALLFGGELVQYTPKEPFLCIPKNGIPHDAQVGDQLGPMDCYRMTPEQLIRLREPKTFQM